MLDIMGIILDQFWILRIDLERIILYFSKRIFGSFFSKKKFFDARPLVIGMEFGMEEFFFCQISIYFNP